LPTKNGFIEVKYQEGNWELLNTYNDLEEKELLR
jgi:hypothetical protein